MRLNGLHHLTMITGDAQANVDFYAGVLGLRLVKKTVNFDQPEAYHLYFGDEQGAPGSILTWFEFPDVAPGRAGAGMIHLIRLGVPSAESLGFWGERLAAAGRDAERDGDRLRFTDPEGLAFALEVDATGNPPLQAAHPEVPAEHAITGVIGARAYSPRAGEAHPLLTDVLGFADEGEGAYRVAGDTRHVAWAYDPAPEPVGIQGGGTVHHVAFASPDEDHLRWQGRLRDAGAHVTEVRDRDYFRSIYFREPRGILFEIATLSPGFAVDEDPSRLGEALRLPRQHEHLREHLEHTLMPVVNPRAAQREGVA